MRNMIEKIQYLDFESIDIKIKFMYKWHMISIIELTSYILDSISKVDLSMKRVDLGIKWEVLIRYVEYTRGFWNVKLI